MKQSLKAGLISILFAISISQPASASNLPGMPAPLDPTNIYAADTPNNLSEIVKDQPALLYVPNTQSNTVQVFDQNTYKLISRVRVGREPQHVVPSWDLKTLYANSDKGNVLTPFDPKTGKARKPISVRDPYNLYFTPNGKYAVVMSEAMKQIVFRDPHSFAIKKILNTKCAGVNHADWSADGRIFVATCEFTGQLIEVDTVKMKVIARQEIPDTYAKRTKSRHDGIWLMPAPWGKLKYIRTGAGAHGLYVTRDAKNLLITNRNEGSISVLDFATNKLIHKWKIPGGGSPDMGGVSADGEIFWVSGRYDNVIYAISIEDGHLITKIKTDKGPHGLAVWPQPGRYSLGHTGIMR